MNRESEQKPTTLQRLVGMFRDAMAGLGKSPSQRDLERWAVVIHASMSGRGRSYHTVEHVFQVNGGQDPIGSLAILFHDTVYCEVDGGLPRGLDTQLGDLLDVEDGHVELRSFAPSEYPLRALVARIFGFQPGEAVTFQRGLNELASALLAVRSLESHLTVPELAEVVTCIEATIPFRPEDAEEQLAARLLEADREHQLGLGEAGVERAVRRAVLVANRDVGNFAYEDPAAFLSHTWEILPESNPTLRMPAYTLSEYRDAMSRMEGFLAQLTSARVFREFRGQPDDEALSALRARADTNLARGTRYLRQKVLAARALECLALLTGGDAPVSLVMGDLPFEAESHRLEELLPDVEPSAPDVDPVVHRLLREGRTKDSGFDLRHSPLASYLYAIMGDTATDAALRARDAWPLLSAIPATNIAEIARCAAQIATTRADALLEIADKLEAGVHH
ncbi:MAG: hypothetical protein AB7S26_18245 [Sandaracinaceae bacterium]